MAHCFGAARTKPPGRTRQTALFSAEIAVWRVISKRYRAAAGASQTEQQRDSSGSERNGGVAVMFPLLPTRSYGAIDLIALL
jgi:hypothetical protein